MPEKLETAVAVWGDRHFPATTIADACRALQAGGVEGALFADQLSNFVPQQLWTPQNAPMAALIPDPDSHSDAFVMAGYAAAAAPGLHITVTSDSVRRPPSETVQAMLTLANMTEGHAMFQVGGGEIKQTKPYGHPTNQGMSRMHDLFRIYRSYMDSTAPVEFDGKRWNLTRAHLGAARTHMPQLCALGAGPKLVDYATSYADGLVLAAPGSFNTPEMFAERVAAVRADVERKGRNPAEFRIGLWGAVMLHEDRDYLEAAFENPIIKYMTGTLGRIDPQDWSRVNLASPVPQGWAYYSDLLPLEMDQAHIDAVIAATTRDHIQHAWFSGDAETVAGQILPFVEAAAVDWFMPLDYLGMVGDAAEAQASFARSINVCAEIKRLQAAVATPH
jgi:phthiodiolone/phenolphthiodiolone dimycocerosates ketoreductase